MALSPGIIKKWLLLFVLCFSMVFALFPQSKADAADGYFYTDGPRWGEGSSDGYIQVKSGQNINIKISTCKSVNNHNKSTPMSVSNCGPALYVEACNPYTGNCTNRRQIGSDGFMKFTNMKGGGYEIYTYDSWSSYHFEGRYSFY